MLWYRGRASETSAERGRELRGGSEVTGGRGGWRERAEGEEGVRG